MEFTNQNPLNEINPLTDLNNSNNGNNNYNESNINDLNVSGDYNNLNSNKNNGPIPYADDPQVIENIEKIEKKTVNLTAPPEIKTIIILAIVLLIFIIVMPYIFDLIRNIRS